MSAIVMRLTCCWILGIVLHYETVDAKTIIPTSMFHYLDIYRFRIHQCVHVHIVRCILFCSAVIGSL